MPEINPPLYMTVDDVYSGPSLALPWRDVIGEGVVGAADLLVSPVAPVEMAVNVAAGAGWIVGDDDPARQGAYRFRSDSVVKKAIAPNPGGQTRPDRIIAEIEDADFAGDERVWRLRVVQGSAGGSPPPIPNNAIALCTVTVPAAAVNIGAGSLLDTRPRATVGGGTSPGGIPVGSPIAWLLATIPVGYLEFAGQAITQAQYPKLYALFGSTLPDLRDRVLLGASPTKAVGSVGGEDAHILTTAELAAHGHGAADRNLDHSHGANHGHPIGLRGAWDVGGYTAALGGGGAMADANDVVKFVGLQTTGAGSTLDHLHGSAGGGAAHNNLQPYRAVRWITVAG